MMHGHEKSDPAIVAVKPTNKAERSAAELVERRAGTKGNAGQQSTRRTQSRVSVTQDVGSHTATLLPSLPEVGAVCGKAARTDLCGGREVTRVPTAKRDARAILLRCSDDRFGSKAASCLTDRISAFANALNRLRDSCEVRPGLSIIPRGEIVGSGGTRLS